MTQKTIEVVVAPDGSLRIEATGFQGADCEKATAFLEQALGIPGRKTRKAEYYRHAELNRKQRIGQ